MTLILSGTNGLSDVDGSAATPAIRGTDANTGIFFPAADTIAFAEGGVESMRIDSSGNVGIGTATPAQALEVVRTSTPTINITETSGSGTPKLAFLSNTAERGAISVNFATAEMRFATGTSGNTYFQTFYTNATERARIDSSGNLLVGKTASSTLSVGVESRPDGIFIATRSASTNATETMVVYSTGVSALRFYVGMGGTVYATSTTISAISDQRLKENVQDLDVGLDKIMALKPRKFDWKEGKGKDIKGDRGWIAQEFEQVFPDMVDEWRDPAPEGEDPYKSVRADLIPVLVKAIQEMKAIIDTQASTITQLQADVEALKAQP